MRTMMWRPAVATALALVACLHGAHAQECEADVALQAELQAALDKLSAQEATDDKIAALERKVEALEASKEELIAQQEASGGDVLAEKARLEGELRKKIEKLHASQLKLAEVQKELEQERKGSTGKTGNADKSIAAELASAKEGEAKAKKRVAALEKQLREEKAKHDKETARLKRAASISTQPWYLIAAQRGYERMEEIRETVTTQYQNKWLPKSQQAGAALREQLAPVLSVVDGATEPVRRALRVEYEKVRPQFEAQVKPHLDQARAELGAATRDARRAAGRFANDFRVHFLAFRQRGIMTLLRQPATAPYAEEIIDTAVYLVIVLTVLLVAPPLIRLAFSLVLGVLYYGLCCCCVRRVCCCCGQRRAPPPGPAKTRGSL